jgi:hypothetical protein
MNLKAQMSDPQKKIRSKIGNPVGGDDFWPRPDVVDPLFDALVNDKGSRRLFGLRRIGKTSVVLELERRLRARADLTVIQIDVQGVSRFKDFLNKLFEQIPAETRLQQTKKSIATNAALQSFLPALATRLTGSAATQAQSTFHNEFEHKAVWAGDIEAALEEAGPIVLIIDELPFMLRNMMRDGYKPFDAERFLATLRSWRMNSGVRMLLSGSIGLAQLERLDGVAVADHIGDLYPVSLPPLSRAQAIELVEALALGEEVDDWTTALSEAIVDASAELWPIFLQYGFNDVLRSRERDPSKVKAIVEAQVRQALDENFYTQFSTRLSRYGNDEKSVRAILKTVVAADPEPVTFAAIDEALAKLNAGERRDDLLEALREDDFMSFDTESQTLRAASKLVPLWVRARAWGR